MAASMGQCSIFLVALFPFLVYGSEPRVSLEGVVYALEKIVGYYKNNYKMVNLDGLFGLRVLEGQLMLINSERELGMLNHISLSVLSRIKAMEIQTTKISQDALEYVRNEDEKYFEQMKYVIDKPWKVFKKGKKINEKLRWDPKYYKMTSDKTIEEDISDKCINELTGTATKPKCSISSKCVETMTRKGHVEYDITHELLWAILAEKVDCLGKVNKFLPWFNLKSIEEMHEEFCCNNFFEMKHLVHNYFSGVIPPFYQDLFMEQQFVCPSIGFSEFLHLNYLKQILSWMHPSGCYGKMPLSTNKNIVLLNSHINIKDYYNEVGNNEQKPAEKDIHERALPPPASKKDTKSDLAFLAEPALQKSALQILNRKASSSVTASSSSSSSIINSLSNQPQNRFIHKMLARDMQKNDAELHLADIEHAKSAASNTLKGDRLEPIPIQPKHMGAPVNATSQWKNWPPSLIMGHKKTDSYVLQNKNKHQRKLLVEKELSDGCLIHKTALAASSLSLYLNFLLYHTLDQLNHSDNVWHSASQRLLLHTASKGGSDGQLLKVSERPILFVQKDMDLMIPDPAARKGPAGKAGVQEQILGRDTGMGMAPNRRDDAGEENDYDEYEEDKILGKNYHDKKVVHFGNNKESLKSLDENNEDYDNESLDEDEDGDYTYYDENDEGLEKQEQHVKQKKYFQNAGIEKKQIVPRIPNNLAFQGRFAHEGHEVHYSDSSSPTGIVLITVTFTLVLLLLMFRFIRKRRIHIRYNPTSFLKL